MPLVVIPLDAVEELRACWDREVVVERLPHGVVVFDGLLRLPVQSRKEGAEVVYAISRRSFGFLPRLLYDAILDEQFVDGEVLLECDEILERLFDAGVGRPRL